MGAGEFVLGGFILTRFSDRASHMDPALVPARLLTASECIAPIAPGVWALDWASATTESRLDHLRAFGLPDERLGDLVTWCTSKFDRGIGWPGVFTELAVAREFLRLFVPLDHDARLLALCLAASDARAFLEAAATGPGTAEFATLTVVRRSLPPPVGGVPLGSDVLGVEVSGSFHSFLCNGLEKDIHRRFAVRPNALGLYDDHDVARRAAESMEADGGAEPVPWFAWRILEYSRRATLVEDREEQGVQLRPPRH